MRPRDLEGVRALLDIDREWQIVQRDPAPGIEESLFTLSNGYVGWRGAPEEGEPASSDLCLVNGFYETWPLVRAAEGHGMPQVGQKHIGAADAKGLELFVDDARFTHCARNIERFERRLDLRAGTLEREVEWRTPTGKRVLIRSLRLVSFARRHLCAARCEVTLLDEPADVMLVSHLVVRPVGDQQGDPHHSLPRGERLRHVAGRAGERRLMLCHETIGSGVRLACGVDHVVDATGHRATRSLDERRAHLVVVGEARPGQAVAVTKFAAYHTGAPGHCADHLCDAAELTLDRALDDGLHRVVAEQRGYLDDFWASSGVDIEPAAGARSAVRDLRQGLRLNQFHVLQATARADGLPMPAQGLTSDRYLGHTLWETESAVLPFLTYTSPALARPLLAFRHRTLDAARARRREMRLPAGAAYPWRTIDGREASAFFPQGAAQHHINAIIAQAVARYAAATGDPDVLRGWGAEILIETARLWPGLGFFSDRRGGRFCIPAVTGPDEYDAIVDNDLYTNAMARENLRLAAHVVERTRERDPAAYDRLVAATGVDGDEVAEWRRVANAMEIPFDERLGIHAQNDTFLDKPLWDLANTPSDSYPLNDHFHHLVLYRHQVLKQPSLIVAMLLLPDDFTDDELRRAFEYYDPLITGDSSLSLPFQAVAAFASGDLHVGFTYARLAALIDLADIQGTTRAGCHVGSMGATWMTVVHGIAGMRDHGGRLRFRPQLPQQIARVRLRLRLRTGVLGVELADGRVRYELEEGTRATFGHRGEDIVLTAASRTADRPLPAAPMSLPRPPGVAGAAATTRESLPADATVAPDRTRFRLDA